MLQNLTVLQGPQKETPPAGVSAILSCSYPPAPKEECLVKLVDWAIESGDLQAAEKVLDHLFYVAQKSYGNFSITWRAMQLAKTILKSSCGECKTSCLVAADAAPEGISSATHVLDRRVLLYSSRRLFDLISTFKD